MDTLNNDFDDDYTLLAKIDNVKNMSSVLKSINFKESCVCFAAEHGMQFVVEESKSVQATAFIGSDIFQEFTVNNEAVIFKVNLSTLVECLTIFDAYSATSGVTTALKMTYKKHGEPLKILLEEEGVITDCALKTFNNCETLDFKITSSEVVCHVIMKAADIKEVFLDLDPSTDNVEILFSSEPPYLAIMTYGMAGRCRAEIPKDCDIVEDFQCTDSLQFRYRYSQLKHSFKSLAIATKIAIRCNGNGLVCLQFMIQTESKQSCFVEYYCLPVTD